MGDDAERRDDFDPVALGQIADLDKAPTPLQYLLGLSNLYQAPASDVADETRSSHLLCLVDCCGANLLLFMAGCGSCRRDDLIPRYQMAGEHWDFVLSGAPVDNQHDGVDVPIRLALRGLPTVGCETAVARALNRSR